MSEKSYILNSDLPVPREVLERFAGRDDEPGLLRDGDPADCALVLGTEIIEAMAPHRGNDGGYALLNVFRMWSEARLEELQRRTETPHIAMTELKISHGRTGFHRRTTSVREEKISPEYYAKMMGEFSKWYQSGERKQLEQDLEALESGELSVDELIELARRQSCEIQDEDHPAYYEEAAQARAKLQAEGFEWVGNFRAPDRQASWMSPGKFRPLGEALEDLFAAKLGHANVRWAASVKNGMACGSRRNLMSIYIRRTAA